MLNLKFFFLWFPKTKHFTKIQEYRKKILDSYSKILILELKRLYDGSDIWDAVYHGSSILSASTLDIFSV